MFTEPDPQMQKIPVMFLIPESMGYPAVYKKTTSGSKGLDISIKHGTAFPFQDKTDLPAAMGTGTEGPRLLPAAFRRIRGIDLFHPVIQYFFYFRHKTAKAPLPYLQHDFNIEKLHFSMYNIQ